MDELFSEKALDEVFKRIGALPSGVDRSLIEGLFQNALSTYYEDRTRSRDTLPTVSELSKLSAEFRSKLADAVKVLTESGYLIGFTQQFLDEQRHDDGKIDLEATLARIMRAATDSAIYLHQSADNNESVRVTRADEVIEHKRRTRTESRDRVLIPCLVTILLSVLDDLSDTGARGDDLDTACEVIEKLLGDQKIPCPDSGNAAQKGEEAQGRLRRIVKAEVAAATKRREVLTNNAT